RHAGQGVLEDLLEREELDRIKRDAGVETQSALVRPQRAVELDAIAAVDLHLAAVVGPRHPEDDLPLRLADAVDELVLQVLGMLRDQPAEGTEHLVDRLQEVTLAGVAPLDPCLDFPQCDVAVLCPRYAHDEVGAYRLWSPPEACAVPDSSSPWVRQVPPRSPQQAPAAA